MTIEEFRKMIVSKVNEPDNVLFTEPYLILIRGISSIDKKDSTAVFAFGNFDLRKAYTWDEISSRVAMDSASQNMCPSIYAVVSKVKAIPTKTGHNIQPADTVPVATAKDAVMIEMADFMGENQSLHLVYKGETEAIHVSDSLDTKIIPLSISKYISVLHGNHLTTDHLRSEKVFSKEPNS